LLALCAFAFAEVEFDVSTLSKFLPKTIEGKYCATEDVWKWKKSQMNQKESLGKRQSNCAIDGVCDVPSNRNLWGGRTGNIRLVFNIVCPSIGNCPIGSTQIIGQVNQINKDFTGTGLNFTVIEVNEMFDARLADISPYGIGNQWYNDIREIKQKMAVKPTEFLNFFISRQRAGFSGTLLGIGTFPWDPEAQTVYGGLWVNANYVGAGETTAAHEIGHNIGLWHTFHGTAEVSCNSACYEVVHNETDSLSFPNTVGDFCADTLSQPVNYNCIVPTSADCRGTRYNDLTTDLYPFLLNNLMSYTPDNCQTQFTQQQSARAHCWVCDKFSGWFAPGECS